MTSTETLLENHIQAFGQILRNEITAGTKYFDLLNVVSGKTNEQYPLGEEADNLLESLSKQNQSNTNAAFSKFELGDMDDFEEAIQYSLSNRESKLPRSLVNHKIVFDSEFGNLDNRNFIVFRLLSAENKAQAFMPITDESEKLMMRAYVYDILSDAYASQKTMVDSMEMIAVRDGLNDEMNRILDSNKKVYHAIEPFMSDIRFILNCYP